MAELKDGELAIFGVGLSMLAGYFAQAHEGLDPNRSILEEVQSVRELRDGEARNYLGMFLFQGDDVFRPISTLSGGERARVLLAMVLVANGQAGEALTLNDRVLSLQPNQATFLLHRAKILQAQGDKRGATRVLRALLAEDRGAFPERDEAERLLKELDSGR